MNKKMERRIFRIPELGIEIEPVINMTRIRKGSSFIYNDPKHFYYKIVKENLKDFYKDENNERKAVNACITLHHMSEWFCSNKEELKEFRKEMPYGEAVECIANGTKHRNAEKVYQGGITDGTHAPKKMIVSKGDEVIELKHILETIEKFWDAKIGKPPFDINFG